MTREEKTLGVFICTGCGIGDCIDIEALKTSGIEISGSSIFNTHTRLCQQYGVGVIKDNILKNNLNTVVIGACSPRIKNRQFTFGKDILTERVNLREQVAWCSIPNNPDTQMMAEDYLRMGISRAKNTELPVPYISDDLSSDILVVGAGISGVTAAIESAKAGYNVILIEKEENPGGWAAKLFQQVPVSSPHNSLIKPMIHEKLDKLNEYPNIKLFTSSEIKEISGQPGDFELLFIRRGKEFNYKIGSIILATGWQPYEAGKLGYDLNQNIITHVELEEMAAGSEILSPRDKRPAKSVLFVQCAGSRDKEHLPYCSSFCCATSLKQAKYIRNIYPDSKVFIIYNDIRTPGLLENFYKEIQKDEQIFLTKGEVTTISESGEELVVEVQDSLIDKLIHIKVDLVVLATGMTPSDSGNLKLAYRQGPGLPELKYSFPDSHFICFPYETRRTGIYATGAIRSPGLIAECIEDATGAALKAIQCLESVKRGEALHPRSGDISFPELNMQRCTDCKRCTEECPFGSYDETEKGTPLPNPNRCRRCGICMGSCPERIINFKNYSINAISSMIKAIEIPDEFEEKPRILAFVCENDAYPAFDMAGLKRLKSSPFLRIIPVRCIGSVNKVWISDALSQGFDGILQIGCKPGDDYQCHSIVGSELTQKRGENIQETLQTMMLEPERIKTEFVEISDYKRIPGLIDEYLETIEEIGPNPFKDL